MNGIKPRRRLTVAAVPLVLSHHLAGGRKKAALVAAEAMVDVKLGKRATTVLGHRRMLGLMEWKCTVIVAQIM